METRRERVWALLIVACLGLLAQAASACGGSESHAAAPRASAPEASPTAREAATPEEDTSQPEAAKPTRCGDGSCSECGPGLCPTGWYCDESLGGGPACGWLPECAQKHGCACLRGKLPTSCQCSEQGGGVHVTCR